MKVEIQTSSETEKNSIKASASADWGKAGSGSGKFSAAIDKIQTSKQTIIEVYGNIPNQFAANASPEEVDKFLFEFPSEKPKPLFN